jgi:hypothetical protein
MRERADQNPTEPGAAAVAPTSGRALPGAVKAAQPPAYDEKLFGPKPSFTGALVEKALALPGAIASKEGAEAMKDVYLNKLTGAKHLAQDLIPGLSPADRSGVEAEKARQAARAQESPAYAQAAIFHDIANPTALIGGTATKILPAALAAGTQGLLNPQSSLAEQFTEGVTQGVTGAGTTALAKLLPSTGKPTGYFQTKAAPPTEIERRAAELGVKPTSAQLNPSDIFSKVFGSEANRASSLTQMKQLTEGLLAETGSKAKTLSNEVLETRGKELSKEFNDMFNKVDRAKIGKTEAQAMSDAIKAVPGIEDLFGKSGAPNLAKVKQALEDVANGVGPSGTKITAIKLPLDVLHKAWLELGQVAGGGRSQAAGEVRTLLSSIIDPALEKAGKPVGAFEKLRGQWGALEDLKKVWGEGAGTGAGRAEGLIRPSAIEQFSKELPSGKMKETAGVTKGFGIQDFREATPLLDANLTSPRGYIDLLNAVVPSRALNWSAVNAPPQIKSIVELLRAGTARGPQEIFEELRRQNAAQ